MPHARAFKDRPFRRIGTAALIAIGLHAAVIGAGVYFFKDYVVPAYTGPRITHEKLERAVADSPILVSTFGISGSASATEDEPEVQAPDWAEQKVAQPTWFWWSWQANPHLSSALVIPEKHK